MYTKGKVALQSRYRFRMARDPTNHRPQVQIIPPISVDAKKLGFGSESIMQDSVSYVLIV